MTDRISNIFDCESASLSAAEAAKQSTRKFVRSEGQLGIYEESRNPTGHILNAWEAFTAYGIDVLEEAVEYGAAILKQTKAPAGSALKNRREALGLSVPSVRRAAKVLESTVQIAEKRPEAVSLGELERIAFVLGLDERFLAFKADAGGDTSLAYRLRTLQQDQPSPYSTLSEGTALLFAEAASVIRVQRRLQDWLELPTELDKFTPNPDYGSAQNPAWKIGYSLAQRARNVLGLGIAPITSMRELVEKRLGIPVVQARLPNHIAGATLTNNDESGKKVRGVVLNTVGDNENVWIRRVTLAHELGHLLYDPDTKLENVRVDSYDDNQLNPEASASDFVEQRANAFAIAFLAPIEAVRELTPPPVNEEAVADVMRRFGVSNTATRYHIGNIHYRQYEVPSGAANLEPSDEQKAAENFAVDFFPLIDTPDQRRGRFSGLVAACYSEGMLSADTATLYLQCSIEDFHKNQEHLRSFYDL